MTWRRWEWRCRKRKGPTSDLDRMITELLDSMDVVRARSKTWKDEKDIHLEEVLKDLDEIGDGIRKLRTELSQDAAE